MPEYKRTEKQESSCTVRIRVEGVARPLSLEEYVERVVMGEMPVSFPKEALKAQATASRTYVLRTTNFGEKSVKPTVAHQVFKSDGTVPKVVEEAVDETKGKIITYNHELITAMFFSTSNGRTESAAAYSGFDIPYLQVRDSSNDTTSPKYSSKKDFSLSEWNEVFGVSWNEAQLAGLQITRNDSGRVEKIKIGDRSWKGREVREMLDLPSTDFEIVYEEKKIVVSTKGYGHGVGMSQYGASGMAEAGSSYEEILAHYYPGTTIQNFHEIAPACLKDSLPDNTSS